MASFVASAAEQLGGLMASEGKHLYQVSNKIENLQKDLRWMDGFLEDAYKKQHSDKGVANWVDDITNFSYEAQEIIEKYVHKVSHPRKNGTRNSIRWMFCCLIDIPALREVGSDIDKLRAEMEGLKNRQLLCGVKSIKEEASSSTKSIWDQRQTYSHVHDDPIGLEKQTRTIVEQLLTKGQVKVVGIHGMGGLGKTTLARQVFQDRETREHFKKLAWVCISKKFEARVVFRNILLELTNVNERKELRDLTDGELPSKICENLTQNSCLVVLDDVWNNDDWNALNPAFASIGTSPSSKILITTRNNGLIQHRDSMEYCHSLNLLSDDDSWKLFRRIAFLEGENSAESLPLEEIESGQTTEESGQTFRDGESNKLEVQHNYNYAINQLISTFPLKLSRQSEDSDTEAKQKLGRKMLKHCKGLSLAILTLGGVLRNKKTIFEWEIVQKHITSYLMGDIEQGPDNKGLFAMLELSYHDLPSNLKLCFMYLGVFPEDHVISAPKLYHLWEAEGLITIPTYVDDDIQDVRLDDIAESYLNELLKRCLVQVDKYWANGRITKIRLHDVLRDMCLKKCKEANFLTIVKNRVCSSRGANAKLRRCALYLTETESDDPPYDPNSNPAPYIRSLLVFQDDEPKKVFSPKMGKFFSLLRVLDHEKSCDILQHPKILKHFIHLRYLSFKRAILPETIIASLSSHIWECKFLETLDLRVQFGTYGYVELSNELHKLKRLRHLYLPDLVKFKGRSGRLFLTDAQLQQMETFKNFNPSYSNIMYLRKMASLRVVSFENHIFSTEELEHLVNSPVISKRRLVKPLKLHVEANVIKEGASLLTKIQSSIGFSELSVRGRIDASANLEILHKLLYLTNLDLEHPQLDQQGISVLEKLLHLKKLALQGKVVAGSHMKFCNGSFPKLDELGLFCMIGLEEWEIEEGALPKLKTLIIHGCMELKMIPRGLPKSLYVECFAPCVSGVENYNICRFASFDYGEDETPSASFLSTAKNLFGLCSYSIRTGDWDIWS